MSPCKFWLKDIGDVEHLSCFLNFQSKPKCFTLTEFESSPAPATNSPNVEGARHKQFFTIRRCNIASLPKNIFFIREIKNSFTETF